MESIMELDELKQAWQALGRQLERQDAINFQLLRETKLEKARRSLRRLFWGQALQILLGVGLLLLGLVCWSRHPDIPGLFATGILIHAYGVAHIALGSLTMGLIAHIDYSAPVLKIQKQLTTLQRFHTLNAAVCGLPWWIMWLPVVAAFAGLGQHDPAAGTPLWIWISLGIGVAGLLGTWLYYWLAPRRARAELDDLHDGCDGIRASRRIVDEIARFERD